MVCCPTCYRVYHNECLLTGSDANLSQDGILPEHTPSGYPPKLPCIICQRISKGIINDSDYSIIELHKIFLCILDRIKNKVSWKTMQVVGYINEPQRNHYLVYRQINTRIIADRMKAEPSSKEGYSNSSCLLADLDNLVHNTTIFYGPKADMTNMARQIRCQIRREIRESTYCIDCYVRSHLVSSNLNRFTAPCRKPHRLLWFQHNGWSFRPCKILHENADGYEVICFGGRHERVFVPLSRAVDMGFSASELGLRMTPPLKKALDEVKEYTANQAIFDQNHKDFGVGNLDASNNRVGLFESLSLSSDKLKADKLVNNSGSIFSPRKRKSGTLSKHSFVKLRKTNSLKSDDFIDNRSKKKRKSTGSISYGRDSFSVTPDLRPLTNKTYKGMFFYILCLRQFFLVWYIVACFSLHIFMRTRVLNCR